MFLVGATGQLLTLILTVCLPFVFFISAPPSTQIAQEVSISNQTELFAETISYEFNTEQIQAENTCEKPEIIFYPEFSPSIKYPPGNYQRCQSIYHQTSSGNKAPPSFLCFS